MEERGHLSGAVIYYIIFACVLTIIYFLWLIIFASKLISAMEELRQTDKSDIAKLKACKKKIIFRSVMTAVPLVLLACFAVH